MYAPENPASVGFLFQFPGSSVYWLSVKAKNQFSKPTLISRGQTSMKLCVTLRILPRIEDS